MTEACNQDGGDCYCAPGCRHTWVGDGECDAVCQNVACQNDNGDCTSALFLEHSAGWKATPFIKLSKELMENSSL